MKILLSALCLLTVSGFGASPAKEKEFVDAYKKAVETKSEAGLNALLYTKGSDPQALEFYKLMLADALGSKIESITLVPLTAEDKTRLANSKSPDGKVMKMVLPPVKKLVVKASKKDANGSSSATNEVYVAESEGNLYIPVPGKN